MVGAATLIAAISACAYLSPTVSIRYAALRVSSRIISMSIRASAIQSWMLALSAPVDRRCCGTWAAPAQQFERPFGHAAHAMVDALARLGTGLRNRMLIDDTHTFRYAPQEAWGRNFLRPSLRLKRISIASWGDGMSTELSVGSRQEATNRCDARPLRVGAGSLLVYRWLASARRSMPDHERYVSAEQALSPIMAVRERNFGRGHSLQTSRVATSANRALDGDIGREEPRSPGQHP